MAVLKGTGTVYMQSLPFSRMADRILQAAPSAGGRRVGEGSPLMGGFGGKLRKGEDEKDSNVCVSRLNCPLDLFRLD